jgi:ABC-2 type transport system ATP-binding protein
MSVNTPPSLRTIRVTKSYGRVIGLLDVTLDLQPGIWGLLGPNGSGKSSLLSMASGQLRPTNGEILICGEAPFGNPEVLRRIGLCPEADSLYEDLSALEFVSAMAGFSGMGRTEARERAAAALESFGLGAAMTRRMGGYSRGMRQRTKLAQAVVHDPDVLLLDEPLTGTDPTSRAVILEQVRKRAAAGALVLFSTHVLHEIEALTDRMLLIAQGQVVAVGAVNEIRAMLDEQPHHVRVDCARARDLAVSMVPSPEIVGIQFPTETSVEFLTQEPERTYGRVSRELAAKDYGLRAVTSPDATLERLFHYLVERGTRRAGTGADAGAGKGSAPKGAAR